LGRRGPGTGLRQARTEDEAAQWLRLFDALASASVDGVLPHLGLRPADAPALHDISRQASDRLQAILARTHGAPLLARVNRSLAASYADFERQHSARLARSVFALAGDGFPGPDAPALTAAWDRALRGAAAGGGELPAAKRDVVVALIGHHLAAMEPLDTLATATPNGSAGPASDLEWLLALARWRRYAIVVRALARVLSPGERQRLLEHAAPPAPGDRRDVLRAAG